jgi:4-azaleucine resistance transporter AzlC
MTATTVSRRAEFLAGARAELPILFGVIPFGMIYGALAISAGMPFGPALGMSSIVFAGSAQFIGATLIGEAAPFAVITLTTFVVNLRHALYSAALAPDLKHLSQAWKVGLSYLLTDEAFAIVITRYQGKPGGEATPAASDHRHWFYLGAALALWITWQTTTLLGILLGERIPASWGLDFIVPISFIGLVVPPLKGRPALAAAAVASLVAVAANDLPYKLGLMAAAVIGIVVGLGLELRGGARREYVYTETGRRVNR